MSIVDLFSMWIWITCSFLYRLFHHFLHLSWLTSCGNSLKKLEGVWHWDIFCQFLVFVGEYLDTDSCSESSRYYEALGDNKLFQILDWNWIYKLMYIFHSVEYEHVFVSSDLMIVMLRLFFNTICNVLSRYITFLLCKKHRSRPLKQNHTV